MEVQFIENFVRQEFPRVSIEDRQELINTAWLFLTENNISQVSELHGDVQKRLKKHLVSELNQVNWREIGAEDFRRRLFGDNTEFSASEDELLSNVRATSLPHQRNEINEELEYATAEFETRRDEIKSLLPPVLFEALNRGIDAEAPVHWTKGFEDQSLRILCWRALVRINWMSM